MACRDVEDGSRRLRRAGRVPLAVVAAALAFGALAGLWSVVMPVAEAPDEHFHLGLVLHLADGGDYPRFDDLERQVSVDRLCRTYATSSRVCQTPQEAADDSVALRDHPADEGPSRGSRPTWREDGGRDSTGLGNQMPQHPPLYYQSAASILRVERAITGGTWSLDRELALLRLVNAALLAPLPLLAWWACRRSGLADGVGVTAAVALLGVPMLTHIGSTLNNDNLLTLLGAALVALLAGVARGDRTTRTALAVGLVVGAALLTKASAIVFPPAVFLAYLVGARAHATRWSARIRAAVPPLAFAGVASVVAAAWWYVGVWARTGQLVPTIEDARLTAALRPPGFQPDAAAYAGRFVQLLTERFWGSFGWYSVQLSPVVVALATGLAGAAIASALLPARSDPPPEAATTVARPVALVLAAPTVGLLAFVAVHAFDLHLRSGTYPFIQGRYLFAGLVGPAVLAATGLRRWVGRPSPAVMLAATLALQLVALRRSFVASWGGPGVSPAGRARALSAWSGWPEAVTLGLVAVAGLLVGWVVAEVLVWVRAEASPGERAPTAGPDVPAVVSAR